MLFIVKVFQRAENSRLPKALQRGKNSILKEIEERRKAERERGRKSGKGERGGKERRKRKWDGGEGGKLEEWISQQTHGNHSYTWSTEHRILLNPH